jgi:pilus assembly protein CpaE
MDDRFEEELRGLIERIHMSSTGWARTGRLFTVVAAVGGTGASVLAVNLAAVVAQREQRCGLLDLHWRGGDLGTLLNSNPRHTLLSLAAKADQLDRTMLEQSLVRNDCGICLLASPEPFSDYRQIRPELVQKVVQLARASFATVIADLEDCDHVDQVRTLAASDRIVVPLRLDFVSLFRTRKLLSHLTSAGVDHANIILVANRVGQPRELPLRQVQKVLELPVRFQIPDEPTALKESINLGVPFVTSWPKSKAAVAITSMADWLLGVPDERKVSRWMASTQTLKRVVPFAAKSVACLCGMARTP